ncbi:MAG TPA: DivIVA domain-containing protein [Candidatus Acidoferrales bacterium]|nr:DivIVA domain-containing protein [Candidatus Acidoferrales bacterium]
MRQTLKEACPLEPIEIAMRRFSRRLFGADSGEVKQFLDETASTINRLQNELDKMKSQLAAAGAERNALQTKAKESTAEIEKLRAQVTVAEDVIDAYQAQDDENTQSGADRDSLRGRVKEVSAEAEQLRAQLNEAKAETEKLRAQVTAAQVKIAAYPAQKSQMTQVAAERDALQTKLKEVTAEAERLRAQVTAQEKMGAAPAQKGMIAQLVAERDALQARLKEVTSELEAVRSHTTKAAQEKASTSHAQENLISRTLLSAQKVADDLIQTARTQAEEIIGQANAHAQQGREAAARTQQSMEQYVATLIAKIETFVSDRHALAQNLDTLIESHADSLKSLKRLQGEMQDKILPALDQLSRDIKTEGEKVRRTLATPSPRKIVSAPHVSAPHIEEMEDVPSSRPGELEQKPPQPAGQERGGPPALRGEIIVSPVRNHYQAAKLTAGVSRMEGMRFARLRSLSGETAIIEVVTEAGALAKTDFSSIAGVPMEVLEATNTRLVLRVAGPAVHTISG